MTHMDELTTQEILDELVRRATAANEPLAILMDTTVLSSEPGADRSTYVDMQAGPVANRIAMLHLALEAAMCEMTDSFGYTLMEFDELQGEFEDDDDEEEDI